MPDFEVTFFHTRHSTKHAERVRVPSIHTAEKAGRAALREYLVSRGQVGEEHVWAMYSMVEVFDLEGGTNES